MTTVNHSAKLATSLLTVLKAHAALTTLVGAGAGARIYGGMADQNSALPRIVFHDISTVSDHQHDAGTTSDPGVDDSIIQFDIEAQDLSTVRAVADALAEVLNGSSPGGSPAVIQAAFRESNGFDQIIEQGPTAGTANAFRRSVDYRILWRDA